MTMMMAAPPLRRAGGLRIASAPGGAMLGVQTPEQVQKRLVGSYRGDIAEPIAAIAAAACAGLAQAPEVSSAQLSLWQELASGTPARADAIDADTVWMLQRGDGSFIGAYRLGAGGRVGLYAHANESHWRLDGGVLHLQTAQGETTTEFRHVAMANGRRQFVGLFRDGCTMHVLSELDCGYARLSTHDPALAGTLDFRVEHPQEAAWRQHLQPAVILAAERTGSHLLLNLLNSSGRVFFDAELMNFGKISVFGHDLPVDRSGPLLALRAADPVAFVRLMMSRSFHLDGRRLDGVPVRGFKLFPHQSPLLTHWALAEPGVKIVHLWRANLLAEYSSLLLALEHGHWVGGPAAHKQPRIDFDAPRFLRFIAAKTVHLSRLREQCAQREGGFVEIEYAAIDRAGIECVLRHLGVQDNAAEMSSLGLPRQGVERVIDRFAQPDAVMRCLESLGQLQWAGVERATVARL
jgi:LPS sulfotransferase NodH